MRAMRDTVTQARLVRMIQLYDGQWNKSTG